VKLATANAQNIQVQLINSMGQVVLSKNAGTISGERTIELEVAVLATGIYSLVISNGADIQSVSVSVK
jgi:hypothetical protein